MASKAELVNTLEDAYASISKVLGYQVEEDEDNEGEDDEDD